MAGVTPSPTGKALSPRERIIREVSDKMGYRGNVGEYTAQHQPISRKGAWQSPRFQDQAEALEMEVAGP